MLGPAFGRSRCDPLQLLVSDHPERPGAVSPETLPHEGSSVGRLAQRRPGEAPEREGLTQGGIWGYGRGGQLGPPTREAPCQEPVAVARPTGGARTGPTPRRGNGTLSAHHWLILVPEWRGVRIVLPSFFNQTQRGVVGTDAAWPVGRSSREGAFKDDEGRRWVQGSPL